MKNINKLMDNVLNARNELNKARNKKIKELKEFLEEENISYGIKDISFEEIDGTNLLIKYLITSLSFEKIQKINEFATVRYISVYDGYLTLTLGEY